MPQTRQSKAFPENPEWARKRLASCQKAYRAGVKLALLEAIRLCQSENCPAEEWMLDAMAGELARLFRGRTATGRGRTGNPIAKYKADQIHFARWSEVEDIREHQKERQEFLEQIAALEKTSEEKAKLAKIFRDAGQTWDDAYFNAHKSLKGTLYRGSPQAMKASYRIVKRAAGDAREHGRFLVLLPLTLREVGLEALID